MGKQYGPQQKQTKAPKGERQARIRFYARNIRRKYPQLGDVLTRAALEKVDKTQRLLRVAGAIKALSWVGILVALAALQCVVRR